MFQTFFKERHVYKPCEIDVVLTRAFAATKYSKKAKCLYYNIPCAFDIETTSFYDADGNKTAVMYVWTLGLNGLIIIGRTWDEFVTVCERLEKVLGLNRKLRLIIGVHNLAFEFQFLRKLFNWEKVFAIKERTPCYALTDGGIEFRCTYILTGYSLETVAKNLTMFKIYKLGDFDYTQIRNTKTILFTHEINYCINDVMIVMCLLYERILQDGGIGKIPLTKTSYVREQCREACFGDKKPENRGKYNRQRQKYSEFIRTLIITSDEYKQAKRAFQGGYTHANFFM